MQTVAIAAAQHEPAGKLIHDEHLAVLDHIVLIPLKQGVGLQGLVDVVVELGIFRGGNILDAEELFRLAHTLLGQAHGAGLDIRHIVPALRLFLPHKLLGLGQLDDVFAPGELADKPVRLLIHVRGLLPPAGNDQGGTGLVDEDGVHLVHNGVMELPLHHLVLVNHHIIP